MPANLAMSDHRALCSERLMARPPLPDLLPCVMPTTSKEPLVLQSVVLSVAATGVAARTSRAALLGIAPAATLMAQAHGKADGMDRQAVPHFLREHDLPRYFGRRACLDASGETPPGGRPSVNVPDNRQPQAGVIATPLIVSATAAIALAGGAAHPVEVELLRHLAERLSMLDECDDVSAVLFGTP